MKAGQSLSKSPFICLKVIKYKINQIKTQHEKSEWSNSEVASFSGLWLPILYWRFNCILFCPFSSFSKRVKSITIDNLSNQKIISCILETISGLIVIISGFIATTTDPTDTMLREAREAKFKK